MSGVPDVAGVVELSEIGRGGFGVVYRGIESEFNRDVAVKVLLPSLDTRTQKRFERERRAMGSVSGHPNIVTVYRGGVTSSQQPYLVMEYLGGGSLADRLHQHGSMSWQEAASVGAKLSDALSVAHRAGILHRDVKPGNVFQSANGEPKLGDFGIARLDDGQDSRSGSITASVAHAPPEIIDGQSGDERSDIYSLASTLYALTAGHAPFAGDADQGLTRMLARITHDDPPPLGLSPNAAQFETVLLAALSKNPADRPATVAEFGNQLHRSLQWGADTAPRQFSQPSLAEATVGRKTGMGQIAVFVVLALAIAGFGGWAVGRAVFGESDRSGEVSIATSTPAPVATATPVQPQPDPEPSAVASPTIGPDPAPTPPSAPTVAPTSTATSPTPAPTPTPNALAGGQRSSTNPGYVVVTDSSGAISVEVPVAWSNELNDGQDLSFEDPNFVFRGLAVGGTFAELGGDPELRDLSQSGVSIAATRIGPDQITAELLLETSLRFWSDDACIQGEQDLIELLDGTAAFQILECERPNGETSGVAVFAMTANNDPTVAVAVNLQFSEFDDLDALPIVVGSLMIDTSLIPPRPS